MHSDRIIKILESVKCVAHAVGNTYVLFMYLASLLFASYTVFDNVIVTVHVLFANFFCSMAEGFKIVSKMFAYCKLFQTSDSYYIQFTVVPKPKTSRLFAHLARRPTRSPAFIFWRRLSLFFNPCRALLLTFSRVFEEPNYDGTVTVTTLCKFQADRPKHEWIVKKCDSHVPVSSWTFVVSPDKTKTTTTPCLVLADFLSSSFSLI